MTTAPLQGRTVLVVEDEPAVLGLIASMFKDTGFRVLQASGSSDALKLCKNHQGTIDLLVTDLVLPPPPDFQFASGANEFPHVHGHELAVRALKMRKDLRVVLISGNVEKDLTGYGIRRGTLPFLEKPIQPPALLNLVTQVFHSPPPTVESLTESAHSGPRDGNEWVD
jgi:CheY-like chemotaxis protein